MSVPPIIIYIWGDILPIYPEQSHVQGKTEPRMKQGPPTSQNKMLKVGTKCPGVYQNTRTLDVRIWVCIKAGDANCATGGWRLVTGDFSAWPAPSPSPAPAGDSVTVILGSGSGQLMASPSLHWTHRQDTQPRTLAMVSVSRYRY